MIRSILNSTIGKIVIAAGAIIFAVVAWILVSPLFINKVVDEPLVFANASTVAAESSQMMSDSADTMMADAGSMVSDAAEMMSDGAETMMADAGSMVSDAAEMMSDGAETMMADAGSMVSDAAEMVSDSAETMMADAGSMVSDAAETMMQSSGPTIVFTGAFEDADRSHNGTGSVTVFDDGNQNQLIRFEDFEVTNGPDLFVWLTNVDDPRADKRSIANDGNYVDLGRLKGNIGAQNYNVPAGVDLSEFNHVVVWCRAFGVLFSAATLSAS